MSRSPGEEAVLRSETVAVLDTNWMKRCGQGAWQRGFEYKEGGWYEWAEPKGTMISWVLVLQHDVCIVLPVVQRRHSPWSAYVLNVECAVVVQVHTWVRST